MKVLWKCTGQFDVAHLYKRLILSCYSLERGAQVALDHTSYCDGGLEIRGCMNNHGNFKSLSLTCYRSKVGVFLDKVFLNGIQVRTLPPHSISTLLASIFFFVKIFQLKYTRPKIQVVILILCSWIFFSFNSVTV